jgi:PhnB protein
MAKKKARAKKKTHAKVDPIPKGFHTATPQLSVSDCARAIEFYKTAFGAKETMRMPGPNGKILHAEVRIGDSVIFLNDEIPEMGGKSPQTLGGTPAGVALYVKDCDKVFAAATQAGASVRMPLSDMFWGDRYSSIIDPFGHIWDIATHKVNMTPGQMKKAQAEWEAKQANQQHAA